MIVSDALTIKDSPSAFHVLIVHFNTPELTLALLRDIPRTTPRGRQVFIHILDNCSTKDNIDALRRDLQSADNVTLRESASNIGFGRGMNYLAGSNSIHDSDIIWLLNSDTRLEPDCVEILERELDLGQFDMISPLIYVGVGPDASVWYCGGRFIFPEVRIEIPLYGRPLSEAPWAPFETEFVTGAAPMMRAAAFRAVGGFPPGYFLYWEDTYLSWKAQELGLRLGVIPSARIWHAVGASSGHGLSQTYYYWFARNRLTFARDLGIPKWRLFVGRGGIGTFRNMVRALGERDDRLPKIKAVARGTLDGLRRKP